MSSSFFFFFFFFPSRFYLSSNISSTQPTRNSKINPWNSFFLSFFKMEVIFSPTRNILSLFDSCNKGSSGEKISKRVERKKKGEKMREITCLLLQLNIEKLEDTQLFQGFCCTFDKEKTPIDHLFHSHQLGLFLTFFCLRGK